MIEAFKKGKDIHANTASKIFGVPLEEVDPDMRRKAKKLILALFMECLPLGSLKT